VKELVRFQRIWNGGFKTGKNPLFQAKIGEILGFLEEEKGPQITKLENFIYSTFFLFINPNMFSVVKFFQNPSIWKITISYKNPKSRKRMKKDKVVISLLLYNLDGSLD
jgi:hypothetical protein